MRAPGGTRERERHQPPGLTNRAGRHDSVNWWVGGCCLGEGQLVVWGGGGCGARAFISGGVQKNHHMPCNW